MDGKMLARLGAIVFVAVAITATAIEMTRKEDAPASSPPALSNPNAIRCAKSSAGASSLARQRRRCRMPARLGRDPRPLPRPTPRAGRPEGR
jgi:conjugative transfer region protein TrbK